MKKTITEVQEQAIKDMLASTPALAIGAGTPEKPCSVSAINLALTGRLVDTIPQCMSLVVGTWIIRIQDSMPAAIRDSAEWRDLLPLAAGTGRMSEQAREAVAIDWMWTKVLTQMQPIADQEGFGKEWLKMTTEKTGSAAKAAASATKNAAGNVAYAAKAAAYEVVNAANLTATTAAANAAARTVQAVTFAASNTANAASYEAALIASNTASYADKIAATITGANAGSYATKLADAFAAANTAATYAKASADAVDGAADHVSNVFWIAADPVSCLRSMIFIEEV